MDWSDFNGFKRAVEAAWAKTVTPQRCASMFRGMTATFKACIAAKGGVVKGWGRTAR